MVCPKSCYTYPIQCCGPISPKTVFFGRFSAKIEKPTSLKYFGEEPKTDRLFPFSVHHTALIVANESLRNSSVSSLTPYLLPPKNKHNNSNNNYSGALGNKNVIRDSPFFFTLLSSGATGVAVSLDTRPCDLTQGRTKKKKKPPTNQNVRPKKKRKKRAYTPTDLSPFFSLPAIYLNMPCFN